MRASLAKSVARLSSWTLRRMHRQASSFPGAVAMRIDPKILANLSKGKKIIAVTGTNGKTTTTMMVTSLLREQGYTVTTNASGANMVQGLITALLRRKKTDWYVLEVDEATWARYAPQLCPRYLLVTNLYRDQLDRYGEMIRVWEMIEKGAQCVRPHLILNADDPLVAMLGEGLERTYFGWGAGERTGQTEETKHDAAQTLMSQVNAGSCPRCGSMLRYEKKTMAHLGIYRCDSCGYERPNPAFSFSSAKGGLIFEERFVALSLPGRFNQYNAASALATISVALSIKGDSLASTTTVLEKEQARFGRLERIAIDGDKSICYLLVKNPAGFEQMLTELQKAEDIGGLFFALNNRDADSRDVSWIWDVPFELFPIPDVSVGVGGMRRGDMALRLRYWGIPQERLRIWEDMEKGCITMVGQMKPNQCLYIIPSYTAMLALRERLGAHFQYETRWEVK